MEYLPDERAQWFRRVSGSTAIEDTAKRAVEALAMRGIPSLVCGGFAVQEYGYPRFTHDVDIIVPDVAEAYKVLSISGFRPTRETPGLVGFMIDRENKVELDLLPAGKTIGNAIVYFPVPMHLSKTLTLISLEQLISLKLSSWESQPILRAKDQADVVELIMRCKLPPDLKVDIFVRKLYRQLWEGIAEAQAQAQEDDKRA